jgi:predicted DNA-binding protein YlxM (UPF0122 family)
LKEHPIFKNYLIYKDGRVFNKLSGKFLTIRVDFFGYCTATVRESVGSQWYWKKVHRLVAETYLPNPENKREVNHIDCNKENNNLENLEWATSKENKTHAFQNNLYSCVAENSLTAILTNSQVHEICKHIEDGLDNNSIAEIYSVDKGRISDIRIGRRWKSISCNYNLVVKRQDRKSLNTIKFVCEKISVGMSDKEVSEITDVSVRDVNRIRRGVIHLGVSKDYRFPEYRCSETIP